jgi:hypothetical protein
VSAWAAPYAPPFVLKGQALVVGVAHDAGSGEGQATAQ